MSLKIQLNAWTDKMRIGGEVKSFFNSKSQSSHKRLAIVMFGSCLINVKIEFFNVRTLSYVWAKFEHPNIWYTRQYNALLKTDLFHIQLQCVLTIVPERGCVRHFHTFALFFHSNSTRRHYFLKCGMVLVTCFSYPGSFNFSREDGGHACPRLLREVCATIAPHPRGLHGSDAVDSNFYYPSF